MIYMPIYLYIYIIYIYIYICMAQGRQAPSPPYGHPPRPCGVGGVGGWLAGNRSSVYTANSVYKVYTVYGVSPPPLPVLWV